MAVDNDKQQATHYNANDSKNGRHGMEKIADVAIVYWSNDKNLTK